MRCLASTLPVTVGSVVNCVCNLRGSICRVQVGHVAEDGVDVGVEVGIDFLLEVGACLLERGSMVRVGFATPLGRLGVVACCDESCRVVAHPRKASSLRGR